MLSLMASRREKIIAYALAHGARRAAEKFKVSRQRVYQLIPPKNGGVDKPNKGRS